MKKMFILMIVQLALLTGCGDSTDIGDTVTSVTDADIVTDTQGEVEETTAYIEPEIEAVDYEGYEFKFLVPKTDDMNFIINEIMADGITGDVINDSVYERNSMLEEKYNIVIKGITGGWGDIGKSVMAGDNAFDVATPGVVEAFKNGANGNLAVIQDIPYIDYEKPWWRTNSITDASVSNKNFFLVSDINMLSYDSTAVMFFNKFLVEQYSLDDPYDMVTNGTWTFDNMIKVGKGISSDLNGDGVYGEEDIYGMACNSYGALTYTYGSGVLFTEKDSNDIPSLSINERFITHFQNVVNLCYNDVSVLFSERFTSNNGRIRVPQTAFEENRLLFYNEMLNRTSLLRSMETDFGILPMPKQEESQENYYTFVHQGNSTTISVLLTADLDRAGRILEDMAYLSYLYVRPAYVDISLKTKFARDERSVEMLDIIMNNTRYDIALISGHALVNDLRTLLMNGNENIASAMAEKESAYFTSLEEVINKIVTPQ